MKTMKRVPRYDLPNMTSGELAEILFNILNREDSGKLSLEESIAFLQNPFPWIMPGLKAELKGDTILISLKGSDDRQEDGENPQDAAHERVCEKLEKKGKG